MTEFLNLHNNYKVEIYKKDQKLCKYVIPNLDYDNNCFYSGMTTCSYPFLIEENNLVVEENVFNDVFNVLIGKTVKELYVKSDSDSEKMCFVTDKGSFYFCSYSDNFSQKILSFDNLKNIINSKLIKVEKEINSDHVIQRIKGLQYIEKTYKFLTESKKSIILRVKLKSKIKMITVNCCESYCGYHDCCCSCCCNDERIVKHIPDGGIKRFLTDNVTNIDILKSYFDVKKDKIQ